MSLTVAAVAELVSGRLEGDGAAAVTGVAPLQSAGPGDVSFLLQSRYARELRETRAAVVLISKTSDLRRDGPTIRVGDPQLAAIRVIGALGLEDRSHPFEGISDRAHVDPGARLDPGVAVAPFVTVCAGARVGAGTVLYPGSFVDRDVSIGRNCVLYPNACVLRSCRLGDRVVLGPGAAVGFDGFGFHPTSGGAVRVPQLGNVVVEDDAYLGANATVDRARFGSTRIGRGAALDNMVHVAHNCSIGDHTLIAAQTGLAGGVRG
ncbi:MAG: UDP-3-O-(3-hydroxymyristoyl)glucosamine N-acyltransferase, partial [Planctomycetota bacterium]